MSFFFFKKKKILLIYYILIVVSPPLGLSAPHLSSPPDSPPSPLRKEQGHQPNMEQQVTIRPGTYHHIKAANSPIGRKGSHKQAKESEMRKRKREEKEEAEAGGDMIQNVYRHLFHRNILRGRSRSAVMKKLLLPFR